MTLIEMLKDIKEGAYFKKMPNWFVIDNEFKEPFSKKAIKNHENDNVIEYKSVISDKFTEIGFIREYRVEIICENSFKVVGYQVNTFYEKEGATC